MKRRSKLYCYRNNHFYKAARGEEHRPPNKLMEPIYNRMLVMSSCETETVGLDPMSQDRDPLGKVRFPLPQRR